MSFKKLLTIVIFALQLSAVQVIAQSCQTYCSNYEQVLASCEAQDSGVDGGGPITTDDIGCMCTVANDKDISSCYLCSGLSGDNLLLLELWLAACATDIASGPQAATECWNQQLLQGNVGEPCYQGSAQTSGAALSTSVQSHVGTTISFATSATASAAPSAASSAATSSAAPLVGLTVSFDDFATNDTFTKASTTTSAHHSVATTPVQTTLGATTSLPSVISNPSASTTAVVTKSAAGHASASHLALLIGVFVLSMVLY
jgi:hypothetical protein